jgi:ankyrin repeat protein
MQGVKAATDDPDDAFDKMLAEVRAGDPKLPDSDPNHVARLANSASGNSNGIGKNKSSSSSSPVSQESSTLEEMIIDACVTGNFTELRRLGRRGIRVGSAEPLIVSIHVYPSLDILNCLVRELGSNVNWARKKGTTAVYMAAQEGHVDLVRCLVKELGADVNKVRQNGAKPLFIAAQNGHLAMVRCLVTEFGADVHQADENGATPLCIAAQNSHLPVVRCMVRDLGEDVNKARLDGATPLPMAAQNGHLALVRRLVKDFGADVHKVGYDGTTSLFIAAKTGNLDMVRCLVKELSAIVDHAKHNGTSPLMVAVIEKNENVVTFPLKYGANPQLSSPYFGNAADLSRKWGGSVEHTKYLEARTHCALPGCSGAGAKSCAGFLKVYYCKRECQLAHWLAHKVECRRSAGVTSKMAK